MGIYCYSSGGLKFKIKVSGGGLVSLGTFVGELNHIPSHILWLFSVLQSLTCRCITVASAFALHCVYASSEFPSSYDSAR